MSDHKTNQAMLPPDPGGLNRALDRAAAEHLRAVAPGLAPPGPRDWPEDRAHENGNYWNECGTCHGHVHRSQATRGDTRGDSPRA